MHFLLEFIPQTKESLGRVKGAEKRVAPRAGCRGEDGTSSAPARNPTQSTTPKLYPVSDGTEESLAAPGDAAETYSDPSEGASPGDASAAARDTRDDRAVDPGVRVYGEEQEDTPPEEEEAQVPLSAREPDQPTEEERRHHELTHMPFRSWCPHCVQGRQDSLPHRPSPTTVLAVPEVAMDYCFLGRARSPSSATVLIMKDRGSRSILASVVQSKGRGLDETVTQAAANIRRLGHYGRVILKTDGEPAIMDLRRGWLRSSSVWCPWSAQHHTSLRAMAVWRTA